MGPSHNLAVAYGLAIVLALATGIEYTSGQTYKSTLPPFPVTYSTAEKDSQRTAGTQLIQNIRAAQAAGNSSYTIRSGVYRLTIPIRIEGTRNFTLNASGVELVVEPGSLHFQIYGNRNVTVQGPLILDADPFGFTQGTITGTDNKTYFTMDLMNGYQPPNNTNRVMFFNKAGVMQPLYQITADSITALSNRSYRVNMPYFFWNAYAPNRNKALQIGNYVSFEQSKFAGGINLQQNNGVNLRQISMHDYGLLFGQGEEGPIVVDQWAGVRRPNTNRLNAGGYAAISLHGGSFTMTNSELSYNYDDLTDIQAGLSYAFNQVNATAVYVGLPDRAAIGDELRFYNLTTLQPDGVSYIASIGSAADTDPNLTTSFQQGLQKKGLLNWGITPVLITLNQSVTLTGDYDLVDDRRGTGQVITFQNCYMHDSLASGINGKGARQINIINNRVERAGYRGAAVGFDPYWWEGGVPSNILIQGNIIDSTPYTATQAQAPINTYVDTTADLLRSANYSNIQNVTIRNNTIINPPNHAIEVIFAETVTITNNTIVNPVARVGDQGQGVTVPYQQNSGIFLSVVNGTTRITNNLFRNANRENVGQPIRVGAGTNTTGFNICNNDLVSGNTETALPNALWNNVPSSSPTVIYRGSWRSFSYNTIGGRLQNTFTFNATDSASSVSYIFKGTRVQWWSCTGPVYGLARIFIDGQIKRDVDASVAPSGSTPDPNIGFCEQMLFDSGNMRNGIHTITVQVLQRRGTASRSTNFAVALTRFSYQNGVSQCNANTASIGDSPFPSFVLLNSSSNAPDAGP